MHDTAFEIGGLVMRTYCDLATARVLELGSYDVNGSLRGHALPETDYIGLDWEAGPGVDLVCEPGKPLPVENESFDMVMASSVFEHDAAFWMTFVEMCHKAKPGGFIYVSAPSNGVVHRFPRDNWRFYPDAGVCLVEWAKTQGVDVKLIESFIGERSMMWNDFTAVFRKGDLSPETLPTFVYEHVACTNVITWQGGEIRLQRDHTEDMVLLQDGRDTAHAFEVRAEQAEQGRALLAAEREKLLDERDRMAVELQETANRRAELQSTLVQREEEVAQAWAELASAREEIDKLATRAAKAETRADHGDQWVYQLSSERAALEAEVKRDRKAKQLAETRAQKLEVRISDSTRQLLVLRKQVADLHDQQESRSKELEVMSAQKRATEMRIGERFSETAALSLLLRDAEERIQLNSEQTALLRNIIRLRITDSWWSGLLPPRWQQRRQLQRLERRGLFDGKAYLAIHQDVEASKMNPLRHYILHGMNEGRAIR